MTSLYLVPGGEGAVGEKRSPAGSGGGHLGQTSPLVQRLHCHCEVQSGRNEKEGNGGWSTEL